MLTTKFQYCAFKLFTEVWQRELENLKRNISFSWKCLLTIGLSKFLGFLVFLLTMKHEMKIMQTTGIGWSAAENGVGVPVLDQEAAM